METTGIAEVSDGQPPVYQSRVDTRPLTAREQALWWVMGAMVIFSLLMLFVLLVLSHTPLAAN